MDIQVLIQGSPIRVSTAAQWALLSERVQALLCALEGLQTMLTDEPAPLAPPLPPRPAPARSGETLLSAQDVAERAVVHCATVRANARQGKLQVALREPSGEMLFDPAEVERWMKTRAGAKKGRRAAPAPAPKVALPASEEDTGTAFRSERYPQYAQALSAAVHQIDPEVSRLFVVDPGTGVPIAQAEPPEEGESRALTVHRRRDLWYYHDLDGREREICRRQPRGIEKAANHIPSSLNATCSLGGRR